MTARHRTQGNSKRQGKGKETPQKSNDSGRRRGKETVFQPRQVALAKFLEVALKIVLFPACTGRGDSWGSGVAG